MSVSKYLKKLYSIFKAQYLLCQKLIKIRCYEKSYPRILEHVRRKDKINVVFFVSNLGMWKNDGLFQLLLTDSRFSPYVISFLYEHHDEEYSKQNQEELRSYFTKKGFNYIDSYNYDTNEWFDVKTIEPDVIFYAQPYNFGKKEFLIENFSKNSLFAYIPYCLDMELIDATHNTLLENIAWKLFYPTKYHYEINKQFCVNKGRNVTIVGYPSFDALNSNEPLTNVIWKSNELKKIIWAPHHSILDTDVLHYSNFLKFADSMLALAESYSSKIQIAFKPHPFLKPKLYDLPNWGKDRTDEYYDKWANGSNTALAELNYIDLFLTSDALIHDCSTFMAEYLCVNKPVMFITKDNYTMPLNEFGKACFECHYKGNSIESVRQFIDEIVINGCDVMVNNRADFIKNDLLLTPGNCVAGKIYSVMCSSLRD